MMYILLDTKFEFNFIVDAILFWASLWERLCVRSSTSLQLSCSLDLDLLQLPRQLLPLCSVRWQLLRLLTFPNQLNSSHKIEIASVSMLTVTSPFTVILRSPRTSAARNASLSSTKNQEECLAMGRSARRTTSRPSTHQQDLKFHSHMNQDPWMLHLHRLRSQRCLRMV